MRIRLKKPWNGLPVGAELPVSGIVPHGGHFEDRAQFAVGNAPGGPEDYVRSGICDVLDEDRYSVIVFARGTEGCEVISVRSGASALEKALEHIDRRTETVLLYQDGHGADGALLVYRPRDGASSDESDGPHAGYHWSEVSGGQPPHFMVGRYYRGGGCDYEFRLEYHNLNGVRTLRLAAFDSALVCIREDSELLDWIRERTAADGVAPDRAVLEAELRLVGYRTVREIEGHRRPAGASRSGIKTPI